MLTQDQFEALSDWIDAKIKAVNGGLYEEIQLSTETGIAKSALVVAQPGLSQEQVKSVVDYVEAQSRAGACEVVGRNYWGPVDDRRKAMIDLLVERRVG